MTNLDLEDVFTPMKTKIMGVRSSTFTIGKKRIKVPKDLLLVGELGDLEKIGTQFEIRNYYNHDQVVRRVDIDDEVCVDVMDGSTPLCFPKETPVFYEPWFTDPRGSYMIWIDELQMFGKLATEKDPVNVLK